MKTQLIKHTLVALALGGLGMLTTAAHADQGRFGEGRNVHASHSPAAHGGWHNRDDFHQSRQFMQQINARQDQQMARITAGKRSGELTRHEVRDLMGEQREMRAMEQRFLADGILDAREFRRMDRALDRANRDIRSEKHDQQARNQRGDHGGWYN